MRFSWLAAHVLSASVAISAEALAQGADDASPAKTPHARRWKRADKDATPVAMFPAFEMLEDGRSRITVTVSKKVNVEEHVSPGAITYVLRGARVDTPNDSNPLETYYWSTPVVRARLRDVKGPKKERDVDLYIVLRGDVKGTMRTVDEKDGSMRIEVDFPAGNYPTDAPPPERPRATKDTRAPKVQRATKGAKKPGPEP